MIVSAQPFTDGFPSMSYVFPVMGGGGRRVGLALDVILQQLDFWAIEQHNRVWSWANLNTLDNERQLLSAALSSYTI